MALNYSHRMVLPPRPSEDSLVSPMRVGSSCFADCIVENVVDGCFDFGRDRCDSQEAMQKDILDVLPSDPFGMDISTTVTAINGWLEDLELGGYGGYGHYQLFAGLNYFIWNNALRFQDSLPANVRLSPPNPNVVDGQFGYGPCESVEKMEIEIEDSSGCDAGFGLDSEMKDLSSLGDEMVYDDDVYGTSDVMSVADCSDGGGTSVASDEGKLHPGFSFALGYLTLRDLLSVEMVSTSLHSAVRDDPFFWSSFYIDQPLSEKITDDILIKLTNRAQGNLQHLSLVECPLVTGAGLKHVLENNPKLTKLSVPGCSRLNTDIIVTILKEFKVSGKLGLKQLRIGGVYGATQEHYDVLRLLLEADTVKQQKDREPRYYHRDNLYLSCDDDRAIDIEMCPKCLNHRLVYDCPAETCQQVKQSSEACRGCALCIFRCAQCGRCINDSEYEETFSLEWLCALCGSIS
ncbi:F-box protein SKIP14 [Linum perenne]